MYLLLCCGGIQRFRRFLLLLQVSSWKRVNSHSRSVSGITDGKDIELIGCTSLHNAWTGNNAHTQARLWHETLDICPCTPPHTLMHTHTHTHRRMLTCTLLIFKTNTHYPVTCFLFFIFYTPHRHVTLCHVSCHANLWMFSTHTFIKSRITLITGLESVCASQRVIMFLSHMNN